MKVGKYFRITNEIHYEMKEEFRKLSISTGKSEKQIMDRIEGYIDSLALVDNHMSVHFDDYTTIQDARELLNSINSLCSEKPEGYIEALGISLDIVDEVLLGWEHDSKKDKISKFSKTI